MSQYNRYCWLCVKSANVEEETCTVCHRSFHPTCKLAQVKHLPQWQKQLPCLQVLLAARPSCWVCQHLTIFEHIFSPADYGPMNRAIRLVIEKLMALPESAAFRQFPDTKYNYAKFMVSPMYLEKMRLTTTRNPADMELGPDLRPYRSPEEFFYDLQLIVFNCKIANGPRAHLYEQARAMFEVGAEEYCRLAYCYQCYLRQAADPNMHNTDQLLEACTRPHSVVWSLHPTLGHYLPAKVVNVRDHRTARDLDVIFFGSRTLVTNVQMKDCYAYSAQPPSVDPINGIGALTDKQMAAIEDEVLRYIEAVCRANECTNGDGKGQGDNGIALKEDGLANLVRVLDQKGVTVFRDRDTRTDETMLYLKDIGYHFCPIALPHSSN